MNKYQYALDNIKTTSNFNIETGEYEWNIFKENDDNIALLQELVDKVTPKKVIDINDIEFEMYKCPSCNFKWISNGDEKYCHDCGQALDWTVE